MQELEKKGISRRDFIKAAGTGTAAVAAVAAVNKLAAAPARDSGAAGGSSAFGTAPDPTAVPQNWDLEADVVIIGAGAAGITAAIRARDSGASVIVVDCNYDIGGHAMISGGNVPLGGGNAHQRRYGIQDDPETYFQDLIDWSVLEKNGMPDYRYNDTGLQRALADNSVQCYDFLVSNGVVFQDIPPNNAGAHAVGISARRELHCIWTAGQGPESPNGIGGASLMRPLERSARAKGVQFLLNYHMDVIFREKVYSGKVLGIKASYTPAIFPGSNTPLRSFLSNGNIDRSTPAVTVGARRAVVIATGGNSGNVEIRRIFDHRLTKELAIGGHEYGPADGSGELAAMAIGASLWGVVNQTHDRNGHIQKRPLVGTRTNYWGCTPASPVFPRVKYQGLTVRTFQNMIVVNQAGKRFYNEMDGNYAAGTFEGFYDNFGGYVRGDWRNKRKMVFDPVNYLDAALAPNEGSSAPEFSAGPQWAIFDADAITREGWEFPFPDYMVDPDIFFSANTLSELAQKINTSSWSKYRMQGGVLEQTVARYNSLVDSGEDTDFEKPRPEFKIQRAPFYAGWVPIFTHDTYAALRVGMKCEVQDMQGKAIPGLFCGGESSGGYTQHGLARCLVQGYIIGRECLA